MKKFKSKLDLYEYFDRELSWRRKEIYEIKNILNSKRDSREFKVLSKSVILISYSHWEGYVKTISEAYLNYIKWLSLTVNKLSSHILASFIFNTKNVNAKSAKIEALKGQLNDERSVIDFNIADMINPKSNLNFEILEDILCNLGICNDMFNSRRQYINEKILNNRNKYAHGEQEHADVDEAIHIAEEVIKMLENYKTVLENAICTDNHLKK